MLTTLKNFIKKYSCPLTVAATLLLFEIYCAQGFLFKHTLKRYMSVEGRRNFRYPHIKWMAENDYLASSYNYFKTYYHFKNETPSTKNNLFILGSSGLTVFQPERLMDEFIKNDNHAVPGIYNLSSVENRAIWVYLQTQELSQIQDGNIFIWGGIPPIFIDQDFHVLFTDRLYSDFFYSPGILFKRYSWKAFSNVGWHLKQFVFTNIHALKYRLFMRYLLLQSFIMDNDEYAELPADTPWWRQNQLSPEKIIEQANWYVAYHLKEDHDYRTPKEVHLSQFKEWQELLGNRSSKRVVFLIPTLLDIPEGMEFLKKNLSPEYFEKISDPDKGIRKVKIYVDSFREIKDICSQENFICVDLISPGIFTFDDFTDMAHFNDKGNQKFIKEIYRVLAPLVESGNNN